ncbi:MAG: AI-2E family transporter [Myxococcota bacterium]
MGPSLLTSISSARTKRLILLTVLWLTMLGLLVAVREVLFPFGVAVFLAYVLHPAVTWLNGKQVAGRALPRWAATLVLYAGMFLGLYAAGRVVVPQLAQEVASLGRESGDAVKRLNSELAALPARITSVLRERGIPIVLVWSAPEEPGNAHADATPVPPEPASQPASAPAVYELDLRAELATATEDLSKWAASGVTELAKRLQGAAKALLGFIFKFFLVLMLTAFLLVDVQRMKRFALDMVPRSRRDSMNALLDRIDHGLSGVVRGQLTICMVNGILTLVGLLLLKVKFSLLLASSAAALSLVPIFGSIISSVPIVAVALTDDLTKAVLALLWIIGIHALEANLLNPKIMGDAAKIHPVLVVLALVTGEHFYGIAGALFAVPVMSIGLTLFKSLHTRAMQLDEEASRPLDHS